MWFDLLVAALVYGAVKWLTYEGVRNDV